jgi:hypothetical protein
MAAINGSLSLLIFDEKLLLLLLLFDEAAFLQLFKFTACILNDNVISKCPARLLCARTDQW